jgi:hypothetical protein
MKLMKPFLVLSLVLTGGFFTGAQSNDVPGDSDYSTFAHFITQRNIFNPDRYPHYAYSPRPRQHTRNSAPAFTLVGTMSYQKGTFAFFSGNSDEFKKILPLFGQIAGYAVTEITPTGAKLQGADKKEIQLQIGDQMREENNGWQLEPMSDAAANSGAAESPEAGGNNSSPGAAGDSSTVAPSAAVSQNDILKRLMEKREQENK